MHTDFSIRTLEAYNKVPECPMCGEPTGLRRDERDGPKGGRAVIVCFNANCDWNLEHGSQHPLPFLLTDDTIYARAPSIVLGTIDKLAMLGQHTGTISKVLGMFGLARWIDRCGNLDTPVAKKTSGWVLRRTAAYPCSLRTDMGSTYSTIRSLH